MSTLHQLREGLNEAWDTLVDGWQRLYRRAAGAITTSAGASCRIAAGITLLPGRVRVSSRSPATTKTSSTATSAVAPCMSGVIQPHRGARAGSGGTGTVNTRGIETVGSS